MKKKVIGMIISLIGVLIVIGLSIWVGFPSPVGFDRTAICYVGYLLGIGAIMLGVFVGWGCEL